MREKYESLALVQLKELAKVRGLKGTSTMKKAELVEAMLAEDERLKKEEEAKAAEEKQEADRSKKGRAGENRASCKTGSSLQTKAAGERCSRECWSEKRSLYQGTVL